MPNSIQENHQNKIAEAYMNPLRLITQEFDLPIAVVLRDHRALIMRIQEERYYTYCNWGPISPL